MPTPPTKPSVDSVLHSSTLLNGLAPTELAALQPVSHLAYAERGEVIWFSGADVPFFGLVGSGFVKMVRSAASGQEIANEIMGPGQVFGLLGTVEGGGCPLSARAVTNTWYLKIPKQEFLRVYQHNVVLKEALLRRTTLRLRNAYDLMSRMASGRIEQRLAAVLTVLSESYAEPKGKGFVLDVPLTRQDLAELAGTTVETTIRVLSRWTKEGRIDTVDRRIWVVDEDWLGEQLAGD